MHLRKLTGEHRIRTARPPPKSRQADALLKKKAVSRQAGLTELMKGLDAGYAQSYQRLRRKNIFAPLEIRAAVTAGQSRSVRMRQHEVDVRSECNLHRTVTRELAPSWHDFATYASRDCSCKARAPNPEHFNWAG